MLISPARAGADAQSMKYIVATSKSVEQAAAAVEAAAKEHKFGVLHVHDLQATLKKKGFDFANGCKVLEVCNPGHASNVLTADMDLNLLLPCRISVYQKDGKTHIGTILPSALLGAFSDAKELKSTAQEVEKTLIKIIDAAK